MHVLPRSRIRRSASIVLGASLVAVTLAGCGDEPEAQRLRQVDTADGTYRANATQTTRTSSGSWWWSRPASSNSGSDSSDSAEKSGHSGSSDSSESHSSGSSQRGGFGSGSHGFSHGS